MNSLATNPNTSLKTTQGNEKFEKVLAFLQPIAMGFISRIMSIDINRTGDSSSIHLSFSDEYIRK